MDVRENGKRTVRDFKLTSVALRNKSTIFLLAFIVTVFGLYSYRSLPKELFPEVVFPTIFVQTPYPGNSPIDIENLVTRPIEQELESISGVVEISSTSMQDFSIIFVEFNTDVDVKNALAEVKDAVDQSKMNLPNDLPSDPVVMDFDFGEFPIININLSGDYSIEELNVFAEDLQDEMEMIEEVSKCEIRGIDEREVKIHVDMHKMQAYELTFDDIERAITSENISISGGELLLGTTRWSVRTDGEFNDIKDFYHIIVKRENSRVVYLQDIADITFGYADPESFARLDRKPVVSLQVIKKSGANLLAATDQVFEILDRTQASHQLPSGVSVSITNDQSDTVRKQLSNLENNMFMAIILVIAVLFFFLGTRNALFVGLAIPISFFLSFVIIGVIDYRINMIVLFSLILALGLLVDNAIVVVENIHRFVQKGYHPFEASKRAVGEIAWPIITSTTTTLAAFFPLALWEGITGQFMKYLPITLIIVLTSSLFVALVIVPVFAAVLIRRKKNDRSAQEIKKRAIIVVLGMIGLSIPLFLAGQRILPNLLLVFGIVGLLDIFLFRNWQQWFQDVFLSKLEYYYRRLLVFAISKSKPYIFFGGTVVMLVFVMIFFFLRQPNILFFPESDPEYINIVVELPIGTDIEKTNAFTMQMEEDLEELLGPYQSIVKSVLTTVGQGTGGFNDVGPQPHVAVTTVSFVEYAERGDVNTSNIMKMLSDALVSRYPGVVLSLEKNDMGPPTGEPINIEITGESFDMLVMLADTFDQLIADANIMGIENLTMDMDIGKPELVISIDRDKARRYGISTLQIASQIRTALFGREISNFKVGEDEYPIQLRFKEPYRHNLSALMNQTIKYKEEGETIQIPINAVAKLSYSTTYGSVKRKDLNRTVTLTSNVVQGYNATSVNQQIMSQLSAFEMPEGYNYAFTGEQQDQQESIDFLANALLVAIALILLILVSQFNSLMKPLIIIASVIFSTIGVFLGLALFRMDFVVVMTGIGIVSLAGIVVNNAIVLIDYIELLKRQKREELGLKEEAFLSVEDATECVVEAGKTRLRPVLLTAITTILGLIPMAIGMNFDFAGLLQNYNPQLYFGGDVVAFWGPISWTIIFGLVFATFLTLIIVPVMYRLTILAQKRVTGFIEMLTASKNQPIEP